MIVRALLGLTMLVTAVVGADASSPVSSPGLENQLLLFEHKPSDECMPKSPSCSATPRGHGSGEGECCAWSGSCVFECELERMACTMNPDDCNLQYTECVRACCIYLCGT